jgi:hypothetical protein
MPGGSPGSPACQVARQGVCRSGLRALSPEAQRAFQIGVHLGSDKAQALKDDVASYSEDEIAKLPPQAKKTLRIVGEIADGNSEALKAEIDQAKDRAAQAFRDQILIPVRA